MEKVRMLWNVSEVGFTAHPIARRSALAPDQLVPTGHTVQNITLAPFPLQPASTNSDGSVNPIPDRSENPGEIKFAIMNPEALGLELFTPGKFVYVTIEEAPVPPMPQMAGAVAKVPQGIQGR